MDNLASVAEVRLANWLKYEQAYNETEELLNKQIEVTYKVVKENNKLKEKLKPENCLKLLAKEGFIKFSSEQLDKARDLILNLYNAGRDVLMCRNEELAYTRLDNAINDKRIEQFLKDLEK